MSGLSSAPQFFNLSVWSYKSIKVTGELLLRDTNSAGIPYFSPLLILFYVIALKLSVIIPLYNEAPYIAQVLNEVFKVDVGAWQKEVLVVDDGATDGSGDIVKQWAHHHSEHGIKLLQHSQNRGKGAAIRSALSVATGDYVLIQDADLEYDPADYPKLLAPILKAQADAVFGSRFVGNDPHRILFFHHYLGNRLLTFCSNMLTNLNLTDMEVGFKVVRRSLLEQFPLQEKRFGIEPEMTAYLAHVKGVRIYEVGIAYYGRSYQEGKKITWKDGLRALWLIFKYNWRASRFAPKVKRA